MITYCGKEDNILAGNLFVLLLLLEMVAMAQFWSILHDSIIMPMRWLATKTHKMAKYKWG